MSANSKIIELDPKTRLKAKARETIQGSFYEHFGRYLHEGEAFQDAVNRIAEINLRVDKEDRKEARRLGRRWANPFDVQKEKALIDFHRFLELLHPETREIALELLHDQILD